MEYYNRQICVTYAELTGGAEPVMKAGTLSQNLRRNRIINVRRGGGEGSIALYLWESIPVKYQERFVAKYGNPADVIKKAMERDRVRIDDRAKDWFENYTYTNKQGSRTGLSDHQKEEYTVNASVLNELIRLEGERRAMRSSLNARTTDTWEVVLENSERLREVTGHTLPSSEARLKARIREYKKDGYACLVSRKLGNSSAVKITGEFGRLIVALKRSRCPVYNDSQLFAEANRVAVEKGWKPLKSLGGLKKYLNSPEVQQLWHDAVFGEQKARKRFERKQRTELPARRDSLWYGDGTKLNIYYLDERGAVRTTNVYEVVDAATEVLLGYYIGDGEDYENQYHAYRMAIMRAGHKPYEIVYDNQGGHKKLTSDNFFSRICRLHRPTKPYNGESKTIENIFGRFQQQVLHKDWAFTGQNVTARKATSAPNVEFAMENRRNLYTLDELKQRYARAREEWNSMPHPATGRPRIEMYNESVNEETPEVTETDMVNMFWVFAARQATFTDQGLKLTVKGKSYQYEVFSEPGVPDHEWRRKNTYRKFIVAYDPDDMTSVRLYTKLPGGDKRFERVAEPYMVIHRAQQDQTEADKAFIRQEQTANDAERAERIMAGREIEYEHGVAPEQHGLNSPKPRGASKEVLRQIEKRTSALRHERKKSGTLGQYQKQVSMADYLDLDQDDLPPVPSKIDYKKTIGKL